MGLEDENKFAQYHRRGKRDIMSQFERNIYRISSLSPDC